MADIAKHVRPDFQLSTTAAVAANGEATQKAPDEIFGTTKHGVIVRIDLNLR